MFHWLWRLSPPASAVPVVSPLLLTQLTCVWPACALRSTSQRESPSKSQCISASSVNGAFHAFNNKHITVVFVLYTAVHPLYYCFSLEGIYRWNVAVRTVCFYLNAFPLLRRYLQPPATWVQCALESRELLALCLKKLKSSMSKVSLFLTQCH